MASTTLPTRPVVASDWVEYERTSMAGLLARVQAAESARIASYWAVPVWTPICSPHRLRWSEGSTPRGLPETTLKREPTLM